MTVLVVVEVVVRLYMYDMRSLEMFLIHVYHVNLRGYIT